MGGRGVGATRVKGSQEYKEGWVVGDAEVNGSQRYRGVLEIR